MSTVAIDTTNNSPAPEYEDSITPQQKEPSIIESFLTTTSRTTSIHDTDLTDKLFGDVTCGLLSTLFVSPFVSIVDKAIVERTSAKKPILKSMWNTTSQIVRDPKAYLKSPLFLMMWFVYGSTYVTANSIKTFVEHSEYKQLESTERHRRSNNIQSENNQSSFGKTAIFACTTIVNSGSSLLKDRVYATMFSSASATATATAKKIPLLTYGLWCTRDFMVIGSSFVLPELMSDKLQKLQSSSSSSSRDSFPKLEKHMINAFSQMMCPMVTQIAVAPVQILALDLYNRPNNNKNVITSSSSPSVASRLQIIKRDFFSIVGARICRIAPAYGIGGIGNTYLRDSYRDYLIRREVQCQLQKRQSEMGRGNKGTKNLVGLVAYSKQNNDHY